MSEEGVVFQVPTAMVAAEAPAPVGPSEDGLTAEEPPAYIVVPFNGRDVFYKRVDG